MTSCAVALAGVAACAPAASAQSGGAALSSSTPSVDSVTCGRGCADSATVQPGGTVTLRGANLDRATAVVFLGGSGSSDDVRVAIATRDASRVDVKVPAKARSGQVAAVTDTGAATPASAPSIRIGRSAAKSLTTVAAPAPVLAPVPGIAQLDAGVATRRLGKVTAGVTVAYASQASAPVPVRLDVVSVADGLSVHSVERTAAPGTQETVTWNGKIDGGLALDGKYEVRVSTGAAALTPTASTPAVTSETAGLAAGGAGPTAGGAAALGSPPPPGAARIGAFTFVSAIFPVRGPHTYGESQARFGAGRSGHSHEGQDVMARCGVPVVAARGGIVSQSTYHSAAGNYVVIDDAVTGESQSYMHFRDPALVKRGDAVETGQQIGVVGTTGSSSACHLHFELWTAPGWYRGGSAIDPLATLKRWDKLS